MPITRSIFHATAILSLALTSCFGPAPGRGTKARAAFHATERIVVALDDFHRDHGYYPAKEEELVPRYLPSLDTLSWVYHAKRHGLGYQREKDGSFTLWFGYESGFLSSWNNCSYFSKTRKWDCYGYY